MTENPLDKLVIFLLSQEVKITGIKTTVDVEVVRKMEVEALLKEDFILRKDAIPKAKTKDEAVLCLNRDDLRCEWGQCGFCGVPELMWKLKTGQMPADMKVKMGKSEILQKLRG